jgi:hypothetical protein
MLSRLYPLLVGLLVGWKKRYDGGCDEARFDGRKGRVDSYHGNRYGHPIAYVRFSPEDPIVRVVPGFTSEAYHRRLRTGRSLQAVVVWSNGVPAAFFR